MFVLYNYIFMEEVKAKSQFPAMEEGVLEFWSKNDIFNKSVEKDAPHGLFVFYDGPPFATGTPHYGHLVGNLMKDVVPRFWTMKGFRVERKWGWDCHGLPIENIIEKDLGFKSKKDIIAYGIDKFNNACRERVMEYAGEWEKTINRFGRWVDMSNPYRTMDLDYMESIWWAFKQLYDKDLIYEGYRSMHICPRCETTLSQSEVAEGYRDIKDLSAVAKFKVERNSTLHQYTNSDIYVLAWTTTPWTLIGNVALAVGADIDYVLLQMKDNNETLLLAKSRLSDVMKERGFDVIAELKGTDLVGLKYEPLFDYYAKDLNLKNKDNGWQIYPADFVTTEDGTGVVHIAPAFGEDDLNLGKENNLPFVQHVGMDGLIKAEAVDFTGLSVKPSEDHMTTDIEIIKYLAGKNLLFDKSKYEHSYPHCWRCDTPLLNYATSSWFINVIKIKDTALETAKDINWSPEHIKEGRFGQWLAGARDWSISRQRFWASCLPIWKCSACPNIKVFGSVTELESASGVTITDLHKDALDPIQVKCDCGQMMTRIPDVLDCWFESGSMPFAQLHYPFANKEKFDANFPAQYIAEGVDQTRTWFYYMHIVSNGIFAKHAFENCMVNGTVLAEDGKKMSKKLKNYPDPNEILEHFGADALRMYLLSSPVMQAENFNFTAKGVEESLRKNVMLLWNIYMFYEPYAVDVVSDNAPDSDNVLDLWIDARLNQLIAEITDSMTAYDLPRSVRPITKFIDDFSTWYLRRSRDRFKADDKDQVVAEIGYVLKTLSRLIAPFMPFMAESLWQKLSGYNFTDANQSVHLQAWPESVESNTEILDDMDLTKKAVEVGLAARDKAGIKVRQPLACATINNCQIDENYIQLVKDELNVLEVKTTAGEGELTVELDTQMNEQLEILGAKRELVRSINSLRKQAGLTIADRINVYYQSSGDLFQKIDQTLLTELQEDTLSENWSAEELTGTPLAENELTINGQTISLKIIKI